MRPFLGLAGAVALVAMSHPAFAHEGQGRYADAMPEHSVPAPNDLGRADGRRAAFDPRARDAWLDDCHRQARHGGAAGECEAYLDRYYQAYTQGGYQRGYPGAPGPSGYGYGAPGYVPMAGYAAPVMMVPVVMMPVAPPPHCTETVEYVTEYVPVPHRRVVPLRAVKEVPDKRVKLQPIK